MSRLVPIATASLIVAGTWAPAAQQQVATATATRTVNSAVTKAALAKAKENALTVIQGNAINWTDGQMTNAVVRLRDARFGRIVETQVTDQSTSQLLNVNAGEAVSAVVKPPFRIPPFAGLMGSTNTPSAAAVASEAAASGVMSVVPTIPVSPNQ